MQISVEKTEGLGRRMTVELPATDFEAAVESKLKQLARSARIKGFRPGKAPMRVVMSRYGSEVRREVFNEAVQSSLYEALSREHLQPAGQPYVEPLPEEGGKGLRYMATFEVYPDIEPAAVSELELSRPVVVITEADVDQVIETMRKQHQNWIPVERAAEEGDQVVIDFNGTIDGEAFQGGAGKEVPLVIGSGRFVAGFEEQLEGATAGEDRTVGVQFQDDYAGQAVAGKRAEFSVTVRSVAEPRLAEVDEDFIKQFGVAEGSLEAFRAEVRASMQRELDQAMRDRLKQEVMDKLLAANAIEVPTALVQHEAARLAESMRANLANQGVAEHKASGVDPALFQAEARRRVALGLLIREIVKRQQLQADPDKVRSTIEGMATGYEKPQDVVNWYYSDKQRLGEIESYVLEGEVVAWVLNNARVVEKSTTFTDFMNPSKTEAD